MNGRAAAAAAAGVFVVVLIWMWAAPPPTASPPPEAASPPAPTRAEETAPWPVVPARNPFEFADAPAARPAAVDPPPLAPRLAAPTPSLAPAVATPTAPPVKLVGLLRQGGALKAVLQVSGEMVIVAAGGAAGDYAVVSIDEDRGVRLRARSGQELTLPPPGS
jgi:hypothetical protein